MNLKDRLTQALLRFRNRRPQLALAIVIVALILWALT